MKIVLVGGCFDLLHYDHMAFLRKAKKHGKYLIVALKLDETITKYKKLQLDQFINDNEQKF